MYSLEAQSREMNISATLERWDTLYRYCSDLIKKTAHVYFDVL
jgi:hypothetical protein